MPWFYVDDEFAHSKPVTAMPDRYRLAACGLWVLGGSWSAREKLDGRVSQNMLRQLMGRTTQPLREVLKATDGSYEPLWIDGDDGGDQVHQWTRWQPTASEIRQERDKNAARVRAWRERNQNEPTKRRGRKQRGRNSLTSVNGEMLRITNGVTPDAAANSGNDARITSPDPDPLMVTNGGGVTLSTARDRNGADAPPPPISDSHTAASADAPPRCDRHPKPDHADPCRACKRVREWRDGIALQITQQASERQKRRDQDERDQASAIRRCEMCLPDGTVRRGNRTITCPHDGKLLRPLIAEADRAYQQWLTDHQKRPAPKMPALADNHAQISAW